MLVTFVQNKKKIAIPHLGMSFIEAMVVIALTTFVMVAVTEAIATFYRVNAYTIAQAGQVSNARRGLDSLIRDLREMTYADDGTFPLAIMEEHKVGFYSDIDRDDSVEYVEYELASTTVTKRIYNATGTPATYNLSVADETVTVSEYVQNINQATSTFVYYDGTGAAATVSTTITDIRYIEALLIVNIDPVRDPGEYSLRSSAALRNLRDTQ